MPLIGTSDSSRRWWQFVPSFVVWAGITYLSLIKALPFRVMEDVPLADKWEHMLAYLVFALCLAGDCYRVRIDARVLYTIALLLPVCYGGLIELIQPSIPPRSGEWLDWVADCIGAGVGVAMFALFHLVISSRKIHRGR